MPFHFINLGPKSHKFGKSNRPKWYQKPIMKSAIYTDLQRGAWHIAFYTLVRKFHTWKMNMVSQLHKKIHLKWESFEQRENTL